ncbi:hypothetical protein Tco_0417336 [Tanacetum coccineum]
MVQVTGKTSYAQARDKLKKCSRRINKEFGSLDSYEVVGREEIDPNWSGENVQVAIRKLNVLVRICGLFVTIEDVIGATPVWPCLLFGWCARMMHDD